MSGSVLSGLIIVVLGTGIFAISALALQGREQPAFKVASSLAAGLGVYLAAVVMVSLLTPQRVLGVGDVRCFDNWCISVDRVMRSTSSSGSEYVVTFRISSRAREATLREEGVEPYLLDQSGRRYRAMAGPAAPPFDVPLRPGQTAATIRRFAVPPDAGKLDLVISPRCSAAIPCRFLLGHEQSLLHKRTVFRMP